VNNAAKDYFDSQFSGPDSKQGAGEVTSYNGTPDIMTISGTFFEFLKPKPEQIRIEDIAHALSFTCRFSGHISEFYSVAEHCVRVSLICDPNDYLWGLLHDASEAYLTDIPSPIKRHLPRYRKMEKTVQTTIIQRFDLPEAEPESVRKADKIMLATEARDLCAPGWEYWGLPYPPLPTKIRPWSPQRAKDRFLEVFAGLGSKA